MVVPERRGARRLDYSDWHRSRCPPGLFTTDLDFIEYRSGREAVGLFEVKYGDANPTPSQAKVLRDLADRRQPTPLFVVNYRYERGSATTPPRRLGEEGVVVDWDRWETWEFKVSPMTTSAVQAAEGTPLRQWIDEDAYIRFLRSL